jgi:DNA polymerase III subunit epsilon
MSILSWDIATTPLAVIDTETTGVNPGLDRIVELAVLRLNPQSGRPEIAFDSLINPRRPINLRGVHDITQAMVEDAPTFDSVAALVVEALAGAVIVAHNADFDLRFLEFEFGQLCVPLQVPHICTMHLRPHLGLGPKCSLEVLCQEHGIQLAHTAHIASVDATATGFVMLSMRNKMAQLKIRTFSDLRAYGENPLNQHFLESFDYSPMQAAYAAKLSFGGRPKSRAHRATLHAFGTGTHVTVRREDYLTVLLNAVADFDISDDEVKYLLEIQQQSGLSPAQIRAAHARVFACMLEVFVQDDILHDGERERLQHLAGQLRKLGWAPGE